MPEERTVLDHLLEGRDALQREVQRLTAAIDQLDSVLGRIGSTTRTDVSGVSSDIAAETTAVADTVAAVAPAPAPPVAPEPVNPPVEVEAAVPPTVPSRPRVARKAPARKAVRARRSSTTSEPPKSIRVHVLEMLQAENREFGLAEIIDRVHDAGIQAHDDAVRSITIKLMKDGRVERVGRGQYRLTRRGSAARASAAVATAPRVTETAPEPTPVPEAPAPEAPAPEAPAPEATTYPTYVPSAADEDVTAATDAQTPVDPEPADPAPASSEPADAVESDDGESSNDAPTPSPASAYTPSLNLGQPWNN